MSRENRSHESTPVSGFGAQMIQQAPLLVVLVLLWLFLWDAFTPLDILVGVAIAIGVTRVFELPPVQLSGRFNPWWLLYFLVQFAIRLVAGSAQVVWYALRPTSPPGSSIIEVRLVTKSDFIMTLTAITTSLIPGSLILEVDRNGSTLFLHVLGADSEEQVEHARHRVLETEHSLLRALGTSDEVRRSDELMKREAA